jgi:hypothetical protein
LHGRAGNSRKDPGTSEETISEGQTGFKRQMPPDEDNRKAVFGGEALPKVNKPNVRFDEGELEIELLATTPALYSTERVCCPNLSTILARKKAGLKRKDPDP